MVTSYYVLYRVRKNRRIGVYTTEAFLNKVLEHFDQNRRCSIGVVYYIYTNINDLNEEDSSQTEEYIVKA